jgi:hypothetical protein
MMSSPTRTPHGDTRSAVPTRNGGGFYGYRLHMAVDTATDVPLAWSVGTAKAHESTMVAPLLDKIGAVGIKPETCAIDRGYDVERIYGKRAERGVSPVIPLRETTAVKRGDHKPPCCEHGERRFAEANYKRQAAKWRCGIERVRLHADLTILAKLSCALARARVMPLAA